MRIYLSIRSKILMFILAPALIVTVLVGFFSLHGLEVSYKNQVANLFLEILESASEKMMLFLSREIHKLEILGRNAALQVYMEKAGRRLETLSEEERGQYFAQVDRAWSDDSKAGSWTYPILTNIASQALKDFQIYEKQRYREIFITDRWGGLVAATNKTSDFYQGDEGWWQTAVAHEDKAFMGDIEYDESAQAYSIALALPIRRSADSSLLGVMKVVLDASELFFSGTKFSVGETGFIRIFNDQGVVVFDPDASRIGGSEKPSVIQATRKVPVGYFTDVEEGLERFVVYQSVDLSKTMADEIATADRWYFCLVQEVNEAFAPLRQSQGLQTVRVSVMTVILLLGTLYVGRHFTSPLAQLVRQTREVARGNLRSKIDIRSHDEFRTLGESFNQMVERLDRYFRLTEASERRYKELFESAREGILVMERDTGVIANVNRHFLSMFGLARERLLGRNVGGLLAQLIFQEGVREAAGKVFSGDTGVGEFELLAAQEKKRTFEVSSNVFELDGKYFVQCLFRDITEKKQVDEMKSNLIRDVAHELRTPVAKLHISVDLFINDMARYIPSDDRIMALCKIMKKSIERLTTTIDSIMDFSRIQEGVVALRRERFSLRELVEEVIEEYQDIARERGINLRVEYEEASLVVEGDRRLMKMAVGNLVSNAVKFTFAGEVVVRTVEAGGRVQIWVQDTGIGIAPEHMSQIFDKFYQISPSIPGCGIGLAISDEIVRLHGGKIWAESLGVGKGATFKVELANSA